MPDGEQKIPDPKELEKELSDYLSKKYGARIKIVSPLMLPKAGGEKGEEKASASDAVDKIKFEMKPEELEDKIVIGVLVDKELPIYQDEYNKVRERAKEEAASGI